MQETEFQILYWFQSLHNPVLNKIMVGITSLGNAGIFWILLTAVLLLPKKTRRAGFTSMWALIISTIIVDLILKPAVMRDRPCWIDTSVKMLVAEPKDYSFPSGHSAASFSSAVAIFCNHKKAGTALIILSVLIALSRLYLFVHWPTDVLVGTILGILSGICAEFLMRYLERKRQNRATV